MKRFFHSTEDDTVQGNTAQLGKSLPRDIPGQAAGDLSTELANSY